MRWVIVGLFFGATILNQIDRQVLSILARTIQDDLGIDDLGYANVVQMFLVFYAVGQLVSGKIADRIGTKAAIVAFLSWWSLAQLFTGFVNSARELAVARSFLAFGEAGNYTAAPKAVAEWFPARERALAVGIYTSAGMLGAVIAPPLIGWIAIEHGWRSAFVWTGIAGLVWTIPFLFFYRKPPLAADAPAVVAGPRGWPGLVADYRPLVRNGAVWRLFGARMVTDPLWYFYLFWFPKYLQDARGFDLGDVARLGWIIYLGADVGSILGGVFSGRLVGRGWAPVAARLRMLGIVAMLAPLGAILGLQPAIWLTLAVATLIAFLHLMWLTNLTAAMVDVFPQRNLGAAVGMIGAGSAIGGAISSPIIGQLITDYSYELVFVLLAALHPIGWLCVRGVRAPPTAAAAAASTAAAAAA